MSGIATHLIDHGIMSNHYILLMTDQRERAQREAIIDRFEPGNYAFEIVLGRIVCVQPTLGL